MTGGLRRGGQSKSGAGEELSLSEDCGCGPQFGLSLFLLSSFDALINGKPLGARLSGKARQLLKVLAANHRRKVPRDMLIEMLWPDAGPAGGVTSLKVTAHKLRNALDPERTGFNWIIADGGSYRLNPEAPIWIDAEVFRTHHDRGRALYAAGRLAEARSELAQAEQIYRGDYLEEDTYEEWTVIRREELRDLYLDTLHSLARLSLESQAHRDVIRYCHKIVLADPCREDAYRMLMRSHAALNQFARAGAWYAVCRTTLRREVGAAPSTETVQAFEELFSAERMGLLHHTA